LRESVYSCWWFSFGWVDVAYGILIYILITNLPGRIAYAIPMVIVHREHGWQAMGLQKTQPAKRQCNGEADQSYGNGWWEDSVARGLEIGACMEKKGFTLQQ
jgi:hypothetical protein